MTTVQSGKRRPILTSFLLCVAGIILNIALNHIAAALHIPLYVDSVGTVLTAVLGGYLPGMLTGFLTNVFLWLISGDGTTIFYGVINVMIAAAASFFARRDS